VRPRAPVEKPRERFRAALIVEGPVAVPVADLPGMLIRRLRPLHVLLHARRVADLQLVGQELHRQPRHIQRILKKAAHRPHRAQLHRETQTMVVRPATRDQVPVGIIEVEEPLQLARRQLAGEPAVRGNLLIRQKLHRHESRP
jgi:hypothetical protein